QQRVARLGEPAVHRHQQLLPAGRSPEAGGDHQRRPERPLRHCHARPRRRSGDRRLLARRQRDLDRERRARVPGARSHRERQPARDAQRHRRRRRRPRFPRVHRRTHHPLRRARRIGRMRALLFDLDGTLTRSGGAGTRALGQALHARPQAVAELRKMRLDGMTDRAIARALLAAEGDQALALDDRMRSVTDADIDAVLARYLEALATECAAKAYEALPGVTALIERLSKRAQLLLRLCTGNLARGAELKLTSAGRWGPFRVGGYGSDAEARAEIV